MIQIYFTSNVQYFLFYFKGQGFLISAASVNNESEKAITNTKTCGQISPRGVRQETWKIYHKYNSCLSRHCRSIICIHTKDNHNKANETRATPSTPRSEHKHALLRKYHTITRYSKSYNTGVNPRSKPTLPLRWFFCADTGAINHRLPLYKYPCVFGPRVIEWEERDIQY